MVADKPLQSYDKYVGMLDQLQVPLVEPLAVWWCPDL